jgi:hypothetical protein
VTSPDPRARLLRAAVGFLSLTPNEPELQLLHRCFDTWRGIGDVVAGMARQEYDLELRRYNGRARRANALAHCGCRQRVGAESVGGGAARRARRTTQARGTGA